MASQQRQLTAAGTSPSIPIDLKQFKYGVGILVTVPAGVSCTYNVQVSGDDPVKYSYTGNSAGGFWNLHDVLQGLTVSANNSLAYPVTKVRLQVLNTNSSVLPITLSVIQAEGSA
jgi:hypothetical protein